MTPDDKALVASLRMLQVDAGRLADAIEAGNTPWPGELCDRIRQLRKHVDHQDSEAKRRRPRVTRGRSW